MITLEDILGIQTDTGIIPIENMDHVLLLVPEAIEDTIKKINQLGFQNIGDAQFITGSAILKNSNYLNQKGQIITPELSIDSSSKVSCDIIKTEDGFIDALNGKKINIELKYMKSKPFSDGFAALCDENGWFYVGKDGKIANEIFKSKRYESASCFFGGYAFVSESDPSSRDGVKRVMIDKNFNEVEFYSVHASENFRLLYFFFDHNPALRKQDNMLVEQDKEKTIITDINAGFSIRVYEVLDKLYALLKIPKKEGTVKEQLIDVINEAATRGTFTMNLKTFQLSETKVSKGIAIAEGTQKVFIFDESDKALLRERLKDEGENDG